MISAITKVWNTILGDCRVVDQWLNGPNKIPIYSLKGFPLHFLNVLLRSAGQPVFVNNPISGLLFFIACFIPDWKIGLATVIAGSIATLGEMIFRFQSWDLMRNGVAPLNAILVGSVISSLYPVIYKFPDDNVPYFQMWVFLCIGAFQSVIICSALCNTIGKAKIPYFTMPFNLVAVMTFFTIKPDSFHSLNPIISNFTVSEMPKNNLEMVEETAEEIQWIRVAEGMALSMGQVYAINNIYASTLMNVAVFLYSPLLFATCTIGAITGSLAGVAFLPVEQLEEVYIGVWGYCPILSSAAIMCVFFAFNYMSFFLGMCNIAATVSSQYALRATMTLEHNLPVFTLPFFLPTLVYMHISDERGYLHRVWNLSYPEKQTYIWYQEKKRKITMDLSKMILQIANIKAMDTATAAKSSNNGRQQQYESSETVEMGNYSSYSGQFHQT